MPNKQITPVEYEATDVTCMPFVAVSGPESTGAVFIATMGHLSDNIKQYQRLLLDISRTFDKKNLNINCEKVKVIHVRNGVNCC